MTDRWRTAVLTTGRQDYGILRSTIAALRGNPRFALLLYAGGMHLSSRFGSTVEMIRADGFEVARELPFLAEPPDGITDTASAIRAVGDALVADTPLALVLVGDRSETLAAGIAATLRHVPLVHIHGGEESEGAMDNVFRHALTKLSHLHLVSHPDHAARVRQMGESPANVVVVGAPGLDHLYRSDVLSGPQLERALGRPLRHPLVLVTVHPETLGGQADPTSEARAVAAALESVTGTIVITSPNADSGGAEIRAFWAEWAGKRPNVIFADALGDTAYWGLMKQADAMVGNSSSGLIEAPAAALPVINVGERQRGRLRSAAVVDVAPDAGAIGAALTTTLASSRRAELAAMPTLYPTGAAAPRIVAALADWIPRRTLRKSFCTTTT